MKRTLPLFVLIGVLGLLVPVLAVFGKPPSPSHCEQHNYYDPVVSNAKPSGCAACRPATHVAGSSSDNDKVIDDLTAILKETKSAETFIVTAMVLGRMGPEAKRALPIIIRNAERLELFDDLYSANASAENRAAAQEVVTALEMILDKKAAAKGLIGRNQAATCCTPATSYSAPPPSYPPSLAPSVSPAPTWNAPASVPPTPSAPAAKPIKPAQAIAPSTN